MIMQFASMISTVFQVREIQSVCVRIPTVNKNLFQPIEMKKNSLNEFRRIEKYIASINASATVELEKFLLPKEGRLPWARNPMRG